MNIPSKKAAQGSVAVRVLQTGANIFISLQADKGLAQGINSSTNVPVPDWSVAANQPTITPVANCSTGSPVTLSGHSWDYNDAPITFDATTGLSTNSGFAGKFKLNPTTGALTITDNLASASNTASDTLTYHGVATVDGVPYAADKSIDILIQPMGDGGFLGMLTASRIQLTDESGSDTSALYTRLFSESGEMSAYYVIYFKDDTEWTRGAVGDHPVVTRDDVDGEQLFIAAFYADSSYTQELCRAGIRITDTADVYQLNTAIVSANTQVASGKDVTVKSTIINLRTGLAVTPSSPVWSTRILRKKDLTEVRRVAADSITVTLADCTDSSGTRTDVEVHAEVEWDLTRQSATTTAQWTNDAIQHPVDISGTVTKAAFV